MEPVFGPWSAGRNLFPSKMTTSLATRLSFFIACITLNNVWLLILMQPLTYGLPTPWHVIIIATIRHLKAAILQWNAQVLTVQLFLAYYLGVCWILRLSLSAYVQKCVRRGMVALPSSYMLLHNRPNVFRIWGFLTSSSQVWTFDINSVSAMSPSLDNPNLYFRS